MLPGQPMPWKPVVAALAGYALGPMAAALVCFGNLKRLGAAAKGWGIVLATALGTLALIVLVREIPDGPVLYLTGHVLVPLLFPFLQRREFAAWKAAHLEEPASAWQATGWALGGLAALFAVALISMIAFPERVERIEARLAVPRATVVGRPFELRLDVTNTHAHEQILRSVIVPWELLARFETLRSEPAAQKDAPAATGARYVYRLPVAAGGAAQIRFSGTALHPGEVSAEVRICIRTDSNCIATRVETAVVAQAR